jgi:hypothetical protein
MSSVRKFLKRIHKDSEKEKVLKESIMLGRYFMLKSVYLDEGSFCIDLDLNTQSEIYHRIVTQFGFDTVMAKIITQVLDIMIFASKLFPTTSHKYLNFRVKVTHDSIMPGQSWEARFNTPRKTVIAIKRLKEYKEKGIGCNKVLTMWLENTQIDTDKEATAEEMLA